MKFIYDPTKHSSKIQRKFRKKDINSWSYDELTDIYNIDLMIEQLQELRADIIKQREEYEESKELEELELIAKDKELF